MEEPEEQEIQRVLTEYYTEQKGKPAQESRIVTVYLEENPFANYRTRGMPTPIEVQAFTKLVLLEVDRVLSIVVRPGEEKIPFTRTVESTTYHKDRNEQFVEKTIIQNSNLIINVEHEPLVNLYRRIIAKRNKSILGKRKKVHSTSRKPFKKFRLITGAAQILEHQLLGNKEHDDDTEKTAVFVVKSERVAKPNLLEDTQICPVCDKTRSLKSFTHIGNQKIVNYCSIKNICNGCLARWKTCQKLKT